MRPRSTCSTASASTVCGTRVAWWVSGRRAERGDDLVVDAADPDGRVGQVDDGVPRGVQGGEGGADGDGLPGADLAGDHPDAVLGDAPADPGDGLAVGGVAVQHPGGEVAAERGAGEPEEALAAGRSRRHLAVRCSPRSVIEVGVEVGEQVELAGQLAAASAVPARAA